MIKMIFLNILIVIYKLKGEKKIVYNVLYDEKGKKSNKDTDGWKVVRALMMVGVLEKLL